MYAESHGGATDLAHHLNIAEAIDGPALIVTPSGAVVFANQRARTDFPDTLRMNECGCDTWQNQSCLRWVPLLLGQQRLYLVLPAATDLHKAHASRWAKRWRLSPRQAKAAACIAQGMSDKEVAARMGIAVSTARTYAKRLYANAGVHSRAELMRAILDFRHDAA